MILSGWVPESLIVVKPTDTSYYEGYRSGRFRKDVIPNTAPHGVWNSFGDSAYDHKPYLPHPELSLPLDYKIPPNYNKHFTLFNIRFQAKQTLRWGDKSMAVIVLKLVDYKVDSWICWATDNALDSNQKVVVVDALAFCSLPLG